ncbi:membrane protease YdiL (CAAX protease family) [Paenibacillus anaericanus]|uniref:type II CAAX endopeptidase family protein n=1 Tax=Paenibacillus anaericanus TaxID=170367 RepID=UPI00277F519E|nr:CPBP family intramembrane glutamic endopeptidase [Paenibacillus anaericanus]MDQ0090103.1 membrane protease YdiL (CAAX protease family) [Paenibacillus anaericanus]
MMRKFGVMILKVAILLGLYLIVFEVQELIMAQNESYKKLLESNVPVWLMINFCTIYLLLLIVYGIRNRMGKKEKTTLSEAAGFRQLRGKDLLLSLTIAVGCTFVFFGLMKFPFLPQQALDQMKAYVDIFGQAERFIFVLIGVGLAGAFMEEIFFRGLVFNQLRSALPFGAAYLLQAGIYAIFQPNLTISVIAFFLALIYGFIYIKTGSVWSTITIAVVMNVLIVSTKEVGLIDRIAQGSLLAYVILLTGFGCIILGLLQVAKRTPQTETPSSELVAKLRPYLVMGGRLGLYIAIYFAVLQPLVHLWYNVLTEIDAIRPWLTAARNSSWGLVLNDIVAIPIYYFILRRYQKRDLIRECKFDKISFNSVWKIALLSICMGLWVTSMVKIPAVADTFPQFEQLFSSLVGGAPFTFIVFLIVHSIYKEVLFRGLVFNELNAVLPLGIVLVGNAFIYGILFFKLDPALTLYGGMGTIIFALLYFWYRSLWAPIIAEIGLFATYYIARNLYSHFDVAFNGYFVVLIVVCSLVVPPLMYRLWKQRPYGESSIIRTGKIQLEAGGK